jgi:HD domain
VTKPNRRSILTVIATTVAGVFLRPTYAAEPGQAAATAAAPKESVADKAKIPDFQGVLSVGKNLGLTLPDSRAVSDAYAHAKEVSEPFLFNHVVRSWLFSAKLAQKRKLTPDDEVLAVASLLHDLGLAQGGAPDRRFEVLGADLARTFALSHSIAADRAETIWDSIALHATPSFYRFKGVDVATCGSGIACDYGGVGYNELADDDKKTILNAYPRLRFKEAFTGCLCGVARNHPQTAADNFLADFSERYIPGYKRLSSVDFLHRAPFSE